MGPHAAVKRNRRLVPVQHGPFHAAAVAALGDGGHMREQLLADALAAPLRNDEARDEARVTLEKLQAKLGQVPNMYRTFAHAPRVLDAAVAMAQAIRGDLDPKLRELTYLQVVQITDCHV